MTLRSMLYSADAPDRELEGLEGVRIESLTDRQLLWIDLASADAGERASVARLLDCEPLCFEELVARRSDAAAKSQDR